MGRKLVASVLAALLLMTMSIAAVAAAPVNNPHAEFFTVTCNGIEYDVVTARGNPAHILGTNQKLIPHHFTFQLIIDGEVVFEESEGVGQGQKRGLQDRLVTCFFEFELTPEDFSPEEIEFLEVLGIDLDEVESVIGRVSVEVMITPGGPRR